MSGFRSLEALRQLRAKGKASQPAPSEFEAVLNSLLEGPGQDADGNASAGDVEPKRSPLDDLRVLFAERLVPGVREIHTRYAEKGVGVRVDVSDFLGGGREIQINVEYRDHRLWLEGTVTPEAIAFQETMYAGELGGMVVGGPRLRTRTLTEQSFNDFLFSRIIKLVKAVNKGA